MKSVSNSSFEFCLNISVILFLSLNLIRTLWRDKKQSPENHLTNSNLTRPAQSIFVLTIINGQIENGDQQNVPPGVGWK